MTAYFVALIEAVRSWARIASLQVWKFVSAALLTTACLGPTGPANAKGCETVNRTYGPALRTQITERIWDEIGRRYYDPAYGGIDWPASKAAVLAGQPEQESEEQFYDRLNVALSALRDPHTQVRGPNRIAQDECGEGWSYGASIDLDGLVRFVQRDGPAALAGLTPGQRVTALNGRPFGDAVRATYRKLYSDSAQLTEAQRRFRERAAVRNLLRATQGSSVEFRLADGRKILVNAAQMANLSRRESSITSTGAVLVVIDKFRSDDRKFLRNLLMATPPETGLIIDLRRNGGGDPLIMRDMAGFFLEKPTKLGSLITRDGRPPSILGGLVRLPIEQYAGGDRSFLYAGPVAILIGPLTGSAAEGFAAGLSEVGRATLIGETTCGCGTIAVPVRLPDGGNLTISHIGARTPLGAIIEGNGVRPSIPVAASAEDLRVGHDPVLSVAEQHIATSQTQIPNPANRRKTSSR